ncbi:hypothetical protein FA95DRAFT_1570298 [Auriscalpium vulgare]|uniref:Uncharacterized protein n=1 Tax=Auriscalpium vulgare TaxID=40419 RepID=A0ACB8S3Y1_9AGAM|nr:hypothetical protein FA95DRAFT_1570298 [Auriscalpium vulgare]
MSVLKAALLSAALISQQVALVIPSRPRNEEKQRADEIKSPATYSLIETSFAVSHVTFTRTYVACILFVEGIVAFAVAEPNVAVSQRVLSILDAYSITPPSIYISPVFFAGVAFTVLGSIIRQLCFREMGRLFTYQLSLRDKHKLITTGPYSIVRHPSYSGLIFIMLGPLLCVVAPGTWWTEAALIETPGGRALGGLWVLMNGFVSLVIIRAWKEDLMLKKEFGAEWEEYAKRVPYRLFPGVV